MISRSQEFELAKSYAFNYSPENRCILGDLTLRLFVWLAVDPKELQATAKLLALGHKEGPLAELMQETWEWFWDLPLSWSEIHNSGWPLFSVLASVSERLREESQDICVFEERLAPFLESFYDATGVPADVCAAVLLEAQRCPEAVATALLALADNQRTTEWQQNRNRYYQHTCTLPEKQPPESDSLALLERAEALLRPLRSWELLSSRWPLWRQLDRLGAREVVNVTAGTSWFWMYVFPHRVRSDGIISNRIRGTSQAYCLQLFQDEVRRLAEQQPNRKLRLVEAGPHIGDCMLWAAAEFQQRAVATAVEPVAQVVSLFRRSIAANRFENIIDLHHAWLGAEDVFKGGISIPWRRLDSLVDEDVDVLKIHTNGGERQILDGAQRLFDHFQVRLVILHSAEAHQLWPSAEFLLQRGYKVLVDGRRTRLFEGLRCCFCLGSSKTNSTSRDLQAPATMIPHMFWRL
ncbi:unnamed protein product [Effrenium voratum]|nr:unnamed protein product [Effrenium voratum]